MLQQLLFSVGTLVLAGALFVAFAMLKWRKRPRAGIILVRTGYGGLLILRKKSEKCFCIPGIHKTREFKTQLRTVEYSLEDDEYALTADGLAVTAEIQMQIETLADDASIAYLLMEQAEPSRPKNDLTGVMRATIAQQIRNIILTHLFETIQDGIAIETPDILTEIQTDVQKHGYRIISLNIMRVNLIRPNKPEGEFQHPQNETYIQQTKKKTGTENQAQKHAVELEKQKEETADLIRKRNDEIEAANSQLETRTELLKTTIQNATDQITTNAENELSEIKHASEAILQHGMNDSTREQNAELENHRARNQLATEKKQQLQDKSQEVFLQKKETLLQSINDDAAQQRNVFDDISQTAIKKSNDEIDAKKAELDSIEKKESEAFNNQQKEELAKQKEELAKQKEELASWEEQRVASEQELIEIQQNETDNTDQKNYNEGSI